MKKKKIVKKIIGIIIIILIAFVYAHIDKNNNLYDKDIDNSQYIATGAVTSGEIQQQFVCREDTLDGIRAKCQVLGDVQNVEVEYKLIESQTGKEVAQGRISAVDVESSKFYYFKFDTIENCKNKTFTIKFKNINASENTGVGFFIQPKTENKTELEISGNKTEGTLIAKAVTKRFDFETFGVLIIFIIYIIVFMRFLYKLFE